MVPNVKVCVSDTAAKPLTTALSEASSNRVSEKEILILHPFNALMSYSNTSSSVLFPIILVNFLHPIKILIALVIREQSQVLTSIVVKLEQP